MSLVPKESKKSYGKPSPPQSSWDLRFIVALVGAALSFWLASRQNVHNLPPPPTFNERFLLVAPTLLEGVVGLLFLTWMGLLLREAMASDAPRLVPNLTVREAAKRRCWTAIKWLFFAFLILAIGASLGGDLIRYLWPSYPLRTSELPIRIVELFGLFGVFAASLRRRRNQKAEPGTGYGDEKGPWLDDRQKTLISVFLIGIAIPVGIILGAIKVQPAYSRWVIVGCALISGLTLGQLLRPNRKAKQNRPQSEIQQRSLIAGDGMARRQKLPGQLVTWILSLIITAVLLSPVRREVKTATIVVPFAILVFGGVVLAKLKLWIYGLTRQGETDRALKMDSRLSWIPGYGSSLAGPILFNAGRYAETRDSVKPLAFDQQGKPRLTSMELYTYALALENDGMLAEAQKLLEAAVEVPQRTAGFHVALATCLLDQKKDVERARELLELAMATPDRQSTSYGQTSDHLMRLARYAWALAACGRRGEAEIEIEKAFAGSNVLRDRDLAGLHYFAGETWRSLKEWKKARAAFDEALRLSPDGPAATGTKKALAKLWMEAQA
jgi:hypothetical protein